MKRPVNCCTSADFVFELAFMILVVRSAWLSVRGHGWLTLHTHTHCLCVMWLSEFADRIRVDRADDWCSSCSGADREKCRGQPLIEIFIILHLSTAVARLCSVERKATERRQTRGLFKVFSVCRHLQAANCWRSNHAVSLLILTLSWQFIVCAFISIGKWLFNQMHINSE